VDEPVVAVSGFVSAKLGDVNPTTASAIKAAILKVFIFRGLLPFFQFVSLETNQVRRVIP
jgi:hypothetical protein